MFRFSTPDCKSCPNRQNSVFKSCNSTDLDDLNTIKDSCYYKKGQFIFHEGSKPQGIHCLHSGKIKLVKNNSEGKEQVIRLAKPGDVIGYRALLAHENYSASAVAIEDAVVCFIPKDDFVKMISSNVNIGAQFITMMSHALGEAEERMAKMALKPVRERLAEALLMLNKIYNLNNEKNFNINISREDLASIVGTAKETAIRFLSEFRQDKIINTRGRNIIILDMDKLVRIGHLYD